MKKQDNVKLGVLSRIDEKILDKATDTRFRLLMKKRRNGRAPLFYGLGSNRTRRTARYPNPNME